MEEEDWNSDYFDKICEESAANAEQNEYDKDILEKIQMKERQLGFHHFSIEDHFRVLLDSPDGEHCVVVEGEEVISKLNNTITDTKLKLIEKSLEPTAEMLASNRIGADESLNDYEGETEEKINEIFAEKEAKARATILEMVGDLPDADVAPPENVLFVCKLNPVTTDEDLEIIFSRFGKVVSCEVIRDKKTGDSLQYAFVEFDGPEACERAYFKMDNVLIDDRRIHVDFSQSVSQYRWKGKGRLEILTDKQNKSDMDDIIKKERAAIKVGKDGKIERDSTDLKKEKERGGRYDKDRYRNRSRDRNRDRSADRRRDRSRDKRRERSPDRRKDRSRDRRRSRSNDSRKRRDRSRDRSREKRRSRSRDYHRRDYDKNKTSRPRRRSSSG